MDKQSETKKSLKSRLRDSSSHEQIVTAFLCICLLVLTAWSTYLWQQNKLNGSLGSVQADQSQISGLNNDIHNLNIKLDAAQASASAYSKAHPATISVKAPNGQTISYPANANNNSVVYWYSGYDAGSGNPTATADGNNAINLSTTSAMQFLTTIPFDITNQVCGVGEPVTGTNFQIYSMSLTSPGKLEHNQYANCLVLLSSSHTQYAQQASQIESQSEAAIQSFAASVIVSK